MFLFLKVSVLFIASEGGNKRNAELFLNEMFTCSLPIRTVSAFSARLD